MIFTRTDLLLFLCFLLLAALMAACLSLPHPVPGVSGIGYGAALTHFVMLAGVQGLIYAAAVALILWRRPSVATVWIVLGGALVLRLIVLGAPPFLSNDMYRYIWDGWVQGAGINPYRYIPADAHLTFLRDEAVFPNINRANYAHTIYPPAAQMVFATATCLAKLLRLPPVLAMKLAMVGLEGIGIWAMVRLLDAAGLPRARVLVYAWNPLTVWEFASSGHVDAIVICFAPLALLAACHNRRGLSAAALAIAVLAKFFPLLWAPVLWQRWDCRFPAIFTGFIALLYLPYLGVGIGVFGFLGGYGNQEGIADGKGLFFLSALGHILPLPGFASKLYLACLAALLLVLGLRLQNRVPTAQSLCRAALLLGGLGMAGLSPHYPWYYAWLLIPACVAPRVSILYLATASPLLYLNPIHTRLFWPALLYVPFALLAGWDLWGAKLPFGPLHLKLTEGAKT
ncbi:MAG TPA: hypothetical protein VMH92_11925 [Acidocella sp.]|nr:hypothetical protein [Acidocella sp.]